MSNFGASCLRVVNPWPVAFREARSARSGAELLQQAEEFEDLGPAVADCAMVVGTTAVGHRELQHRLRPLAESARLIRKQLATANVAVLFGSEKVGLSNTDLSHCHWLLRIPTREHQGSMNLGQAVAVCLYELGVSRNIRTGVSASPKAVASDQERMTDLLFVALQRSGYVKPRTAATTREKVRRLVRRMQTDRDDAKLWLGMLRQIAWKLNLEQEENTP